MMLFIKSSRIRRYLNILPSALHLPPLAFPPIPNDGRILFFSRDRGDFGFLSNFKPTSFVQDDLSWPNAEVYYQSQKSLNPDYKNAIRKRDSPMWAKFIGDSRIGDPRIAKKSWFRKHPEDLRPDWNSSRLEVMERVLDAKFRQNKELRIQLLNTYPARLIEDSTKDSFWGIGADEFGNNHLGRLLEELRERLRLKDQSH